MTHHDPSDYAPHHLLSCPTPEIYFLLLSSLPNIQESATHYPLQRPHQPLRDKTRLFLSLNLRTLHQEATRA